MQSGSSLQGTFVASTTAKTPDNVVKVPLTFIFALQQTGKIEDGKATLSGTVHIDQYESQTTKPFSSAPIAKDGSFEIVVQNMLIPQSLNVLLAADVTDTTVAFQSCQVINSCEFTGTVAATLRNVTSKAGPIAQVVVSGDFDGLGAAPQCAALLDGGLPETGAPDAPKEGSAEAASDSGVADSASDATGDGLDALEGS